MRCLRAAPVPGRAAAVALVVWVLVGAIAARPGGAAVCGDLVLDPGESCDDGALVSRDGCSAGCRLEPIDALRCHKTTSDATFAPRTVTVVDERGAGGVLVLKPDALCLPADVNGSGIVDPGLRLACYRAKRAPDQPRLPPGEVTVTDAFGTQTLRLGPAGRLCLPAVSTSLPGASREIPYPGWSDYRPSLVRSGGDLLIGDPGANDHVGVVHLVNAATGALVRTFSNPTPVADDVFGTSVALVGGKLVVGAPIYDESGEITIFDAATGGLLLTIPNPDPDTGIIGGHVAPFGADFVAGSYFGGHKGGVFVFDGDTGAVRRLLRSPRSVVSDGFGRSLAVQGTRVLVGADSEPDGGAAYLFDGTTGVLLQTFANPEPESSRPNGDLFGESVAFLGDDVLVAAPHEGDDAGVVYLFDASTGALRRRFVSPRPAPMDHFGHLVTGAGTTVYVSAEGDDTRGRDAGAVYAFDGNSGQLLRTYARTPLSADQRLALVWRASDDGPVFASAIRPLGAAFELEPGGRCGDGTLDPGEECDDGNAVHGDGCVPGCRVEPVHHLQCYRSRTPTGAGRRTVAVADAVGAGDVTLIKPGRYCTPADGNGEGMAHPTARSLCYKAKGGAPALPAPAFALDDQFGPHSRAVRKVDSVCLPASPSGG